MTSRLMGAWRHRALLALLLASWAPSVALADIVMPDAPVDDGDEPPRPNAFPGSVAEAPATAPASAPDSAPASAPATAPSSAPVSAPASTPASANATPTSAATAGMARFEKAERLEDLRYRNLWIGYAAIWLIIFGFAWRTWKRTTENGRELADLRGKLDALEARQGKGDA